MTENENRRPGRPRRGAEPEIDYTELERLLIHGEWVTGGRGSPEHRYPSYRKLAERFGVTKTVVYRFSHRYNCLERRAGSGAGGVPAPSAAPPEQEVAVIEEAEEQLPAADDAEAEEGEDEAVDLRMLPTVREIFITWVRAVQEGEIRITSAGEIEKMMRIAADLDAEAHMRAMVPAGVPTLEELQDIYEESIREYEASTPAMRGLVPIGLDEPEPVSETTGSEEEEVEGTPDGC